MSNVIGLCGFSGSGKDTVADIFVKYGYKKLSFADSLKDAVSVIFGWDREMLEGKTEKSRKFRERKDKFWSKKFGRDITPRKILQEFGTEVCRDNLINTIWIDSLERKIDGNVVITDVRFKNEYQFVKDIGGTIIRVKRELPEWYDMAVLASNGDENAIKMLNKKKIHKSEYDILCCEPSFTIQNTKGLDTLETTVKSLIEIMG